MNFIFYLIVLGFAFLNLGIGISTMRSKAPDYFWSGYELDSKDLTDLKAYNKANGSLWFVNASGFIVFSVIMSVIPTGWINSPVWGGLIFAWVVLSLMIMYKGHKKNYQKYVKNGV